MVKIKKSNKLNKLNIVNFDNFLSSNTQKKPKYINKYPMLPQHSFRLLISGASGCGKTNLLMNLILRYLYFDKIYIYSKHLDQAKYLKIFDFFEMVQEKNGDDESMLISSNNIDDVIKVDELDASIQNLVIFDDFITEKDQRKIIDLFIRSRHQNASIIYISQSYFRTPRDIRLNCNYFIFFELNNNKKELNLIFQDLVSDLTKPEFQKMALLATKNKYDFFMIDKKTEYLKLRYRKNFNSLYYK